MDIREIVARQRGFFASGETLPADWRLERLRELKAAIVQNEGEILAALKADLNKSEFEGYMSEVGMVLDDLGFAVKHLKSWARVKRVKTPMHQFSARSMVVPEPYGTVLIMSPWNYPFQLTLEPLIGALAAGNCAVVKPSAYAAETSRVIGELLSSVFPPEYVAVVEGGRDENKLLLEQRFDYIFFTGSVQVGRLVMESASRHLTPVSLELGGKSPVIVDRTANIPLAARRIAFGKCLNAGQTCVAPDYVLIHSAVRESFISEYKKALSEFFPGGDHSRMATIINQKHFDRLLGLIDPSKTAIGGGSDAGRRFIEPTLMDGVTWEDPVMGEEIFGPILPIMVCDSLEEAMETVNSRPKPLALYLFTTDKNVEKRVLSRVSFGGGCVNDTITHLATPYMGFGGVGESGMGAYHGKLSFDTFTHYKSVLKRRNFVDLKVRYMPYTEKHFKIVRMLMK